MTTLIMMKILIQVQAVPTFSWSTLLFLPKLTSSMMTVTKTGVGRNLVKFWQNDNADNDEIWGF